MLVKTAVLAGSLCIQSIPAVTKQSFPWAYCSDKKSRWLASELGKLRILTLLGDQMVNVCKMTCNVRVMLWCF